MYYSLIWTITGKHPHVLEAISFDVKYPDTVVYQRQYRDEYRGGWRGGNEATTVVGDDINQDSILKKAGIVYKP